jgi:hypothetical protein
MDDASAAHGSEDTPAPPIAPRVRIRVQTARGGLAFEGEQAFFERLVEPLLLGLAGGRPGANGAPSDSAAEPDDGRRRNPDAYVPSAEAFGTFSRQIGSDLTSEAQRVSAYAFFLWNYEKKDTFDDEEIAGCYRADERTPPADLSPVLADLVGRRILASDGGSGAWRLTDKGRTVVRAQLLAG